MGLARNILLWVSRNETLRAHLPRYSFVRRSVRRFMPGEEIEDALRAAEELKQAGITTIVTHLGENVSTEQETHDVRQHYERILDLIHQAQLDAHISVKLTELGLDQSSELCYSNLSALIEKAKRLNNYVWIDMEGSKYTSATLDIYHKARAGFSNVGVCVQSYLYRTAEDLQKLLPLSPGIRLVKGAYAEPASIAYPKKQDTDGNYLKLARTLLSNLKERAVIIGFATHDQALVRQILDEAKTLGVPRENFEVQMLYGIRRNDQLRLVGEGIKVRVLISYGTLWFPWYVRRLAERPANVLFVLRNLFAR